MYILFGYILFGESYSGVYCLVRVIAVYILFGKSYSGVYIVW